MITHPAAVAGPSKPETDRSDKFVRKSKGDGNGRYVWIIELMTNDSGQHSFMIEHGCSSGRMSLTKHAPWLNEAVSQTTKGPAKGMDVGMPRIYEEYKHLVEIKQSEGFVFDGSTVHSKGMTECGAYIEKRRSKHKAMLKLLIKAKKVNPNPESAGKVKSTAACTKQAHKTRLTVLDENDDDDFPMDADEDFPQDDDYDDDVNEHEGEPVNDHGDVESGAVLTVNELFEDSSDPESDDDDE